MIWATASSWSCFCWLYRASPSLAAKNIINLISVLTMFMCRDFSCVVERGCLLWPVHSLGKTLLAFALLHSVFQGQISLLLQVFLDFLLLYSSSLLHYSKCVNRWASQQIQGILWELHKNELSASSQRVATQEIMSAQRVSMFSLCFPYSFL